MVRQLNESQSPDLHNAQNISKLLSGKTSCALKKSLCFVSDYAAKCRQVDNFKYNLPFLSSIPCIRQPSTEWLQVLRFILNACMLPTVQLLQVANTTISMATNVSTGVWMIWMFPALKIPAFLSKVAINLNLCWHDLKQCSVFFNKF